MKHNIGSLFSGLALIMLLGACQSDKLYQKNHDFSEKGWPVQEKPAFAFHIPDAEASYNIYYNIRYTLSYPFYNLYVKYRLQDSTNKLLESQLQEIHLMNMRSGKPKGSGLGDIFDYQVLGLKKVDFPNEGHYTLTLEQYMRRDTLPDILSVGVEVEKVNSK